MVKLLGTDVGKTGYGMMGLTWRPNPQSYADSFETMKAALAQGNTFWNGGELYGPPDKNSLQLLNAYFTQYPEDAAKVVLSIKGAIDPATHGPDGSEAGIKRSVDNCLSILDGTKKIDLFECARVDPKVPIEETLGYLQKYVDEGKIGGICLSEVSAESIRRAAKVVKVHGVEVEFSLFSTDILRNGIAKACAELDIPIIAYSPLGRGVLTEQIKSLDDIPEDDFRRHQPRFQPEAFAANQKLVSIVKDIAQKKGDGVSVGQIALAWVRGHSGRDGLGPIIPIPGSTTVSRVEENSREVTLSEAEMRELDEIAFGFEVQGDRYGGPLKALMNG